MPTNGLPTLSFILAEIYMNNFESTILNFKNKLVFYIMFWARYVDDILCIRTGKERTLDNF